MQPRSEPLLWLQCLALGAIPLELLLIRLVLAGADPGPAGNGAEATQGRPDVTAIVFDVDDSYVDEAAAAGGGRSPGEPAERSLR